MKVTVVGDKGFIGSSVCHALREKNVEVYGFDKGYEVEVGRNYGVVVYCAGVTTNYQNRNSIDAHVNYLAEWLEKATYSKIIYLSSTRIYRHLEDGNETIKKFIVDQGDFYNQTKLLGESLLLNSSKDYVILRLSNVLAFTPESQCFIWNILRQAKRGQKVIFEESAACGRDYVSLEDVISIIYECVKSDCTGIYNVCSSVVIDNKMVGEVIEKYALGTRVIFGDKYFLPSKLSNEKIRKKFSITFYDPINLLKILSERYFCEKE